MKKISRKLKSTVLAVMLFSAGVLGYGMQSEAASAGRVTFTIEPETTVARGTEVTFDVTVTNGTSDTVEAGSL